MKRSLGALQIAVFAVAACGGTQQPVNDIYRHVPGQADLRPALF